MRCLEDFFIFLLVSSVVSGENKDHLAWWWRPFRGGWHWKPVLWIRIRIPIWIHMFLGLRIRKSQVRIRLRIHPSSSKIVRKTLISTVLWLLYDFYQCSGTASGSRTEGSESFWQCCGSGMFIPDPTFFHPGSWITDLNCFHPHQRI